MQKTHTMLPNSKYYGAQKDVTSTKRRKILFRIRKKNVGKTKSLSLSTVFKEKVGKNSEDKSP